MRIDLEGKTVVITGSTRGVGKIIAKEAASYGADVVINGRSKEPAQELLLDLEEAGSNALFISADLNNHKEVTSMFETVEDEMGGVDILINSGGSTSGPPTDFFRELDPDDFVDFGISRYFNRMYSISAALESLIESDDGRVINVTTDAGRYPTPGEVFPGGTGAAVIMSSRALANELSRWNINVNTVSISVTKDTVGLDSVLEESPAASVFEKALEKQVFPVSSKDVAEFIVFLAGSKAAKSITSQVISINGGISY